MKQKYFNLIIIGFSLFGCSWFESDYYKLIRPIIEIKHQEKLAGKINPTFDGFVEPDFPDEFKNLETIDGIDSNHDGLRDDVEIWINRSEKNEYERIQLKDWARKLFSAHLVFILEGSTDDDFEKTLQELTNSSLCFGSLIKVYAEKDKKNSFNRYHYYQETLYKLLFNTGQRKRLVALMDGHQYKNFLTFDSENFDHCARGIPTSYIKKVIYLNRKDWKFDK
jgi:hypothetical protein